MGDSCLRGMRRIILLYFLRRLVSDHILSWSNEGDIVYDPFMGSGTTAIAAKKLNRNYIGSELSKEYCAIAVSRI
jgi:DNA modification methylase